MTETGIKPEVIDEIRQLARKHGMKQVILFGSRARGDYWRASDIDLAVQGGSIESFALDVDEETSTLLKYDIVNLDGNLPEKLLEAIRKEGKLLYEEI